MRKILILENDFKLDKDKQRIVFGFLKTITEPYEIIDFSRLKSREPEEIFEAAYSCTDIVCQTAVANGSEYQFESIAGMLAKIKEPKNVYLCLLAGDLYDYMDKIFEDKELLSFRHHNIYEIGNDEDHDEPKRMDFSPRIDAYLKQKADEKQYRDEAINRPTGRKILLVACNAGYNTAFSTLVMGTVVDELDMSGQDPRPERGVWVWGNGEPVKLVNDCGLKEYELHGKISIDDVLEEISKATDMDLSSFNNLTTQGLRAVITDDENSSMELANYICEQTNIPKRGNRQKIHEIILRYRKNKES